jgi:hypothetical protein
MMENICTVLRDRYEDWETFVKGWQDAVKSSVRPQKKVDRPRNSVLSRHYRPAIIMQMAHGG